MSSELKAWRERAGLGPKAAAARIGVGRATYYRLEAGTVVPNRATAERVFAVTGVSLVHRAPQSEAA